MSKKQSTLFQSWGSGSTGGAGSSRPGPSDSSRGHLQASKARSGASGGADRRNVDAREDDFGCEDGNDSFDELLGEGITEAELLEACEIVDPSPPPTSPGQEASELANSRKNQVQTTIPFHIGPSAAAPAILNCSVVEDSIPGFDSDAGEMWIYPTNYPVRDYQFNIVKKALFVNTLVCLPTGLGKTFIAAVVMYNFYRWYPSGKIVFLAPTKPLVAQQIEACHNVMGIPQHDVAEMTGGL